MIDGANPFEKVGAGAAVIRVAVAAFPLGRPVDVTALVVLLYKPGVLVETSTLKMQLAPAPSVGAEKLRLVEPGLMPPRFVPLGQSGPTVTFGEVATANPAGSESLNAMFVAPVTFGFVMVKVRVDVPGTTMAFGLNSLLMEIGWPGAGWNDATVCTPPSMTVKLPAENCRALVLMTRTAEVFPGGILVPGGVGTKLKPTVVPEASRSAVTGMIPAVPFTKGVPASVPPSR